MLFNSYIFLFAFLPFTVVGYFFLNRLHTNRYALIFLAVMSFIFYGYNNIRYVPVLGASVLVNYSLSRILSDEGRSETLRKVFLAAGVVFNIGMIFYFKYYDFFFENMNRLFHLSVAMRKIVLPLGISFFTFQQVSYVIDSYRGQTRDYGFWEYVVFVSFFPQLVAGPIVLHNEIIPQLRMPEKRILNYDNLADGIVRFNLGLFKKVLLADTFSGPVAWGFAHTKVVSSPDILLVMLCYTFQIYFDFSGYSDMAVGIGKMFNLSLPINFDSPYKADSIRDFWRRWHMTLTRFLTQYVYFPLGGSRRGKARTYVNTMIVFLLSGIWHGANWTFILWGILHGIASVLQRIFEDVYGKIPKTLRWAGTFLYVNVLWLLFRSENIGQWLRLMKKMVSFTKLTVNPELLDRFALPEISWLLSLLGIDAGAGAGLWILPLLAIIGAFLLCLGFENNYRRNFPKNRRMMLASAGLFLWSVVTLAGESVFLYFNF